MNDSLTITPSQLHVEITQLIAAKTGCEATWEQHQQPLTSDELREIRLEIEKMIVRHIVSAYLAEAGSKQG
ncbi:MAG: hypothetical protein ABSF14_19755 [Terriglobia bacterium]